MHRAKADYSPGAILAPQPKNIENNPMQSSRAILASIAPAKTF
jgi:hypothetical protein